LLSYIKLKMKILVIGGSSGMGLAISNILKQGGKQVIIVDRKEPQCGDFEFHQVNLVSFDESSFAGFSSDIDGVVITAGFGRVAPFTEMSSTEIEEVTKVDALAVAKILKIFSDRLFSQKDFYVAVMGSIAGLISSPLFATYGASKAYVCKLIESLNAELEYQGYKNRILNVSPGALKGTSFNGGKTDLSLLDGLAGGIVERMFRKETLYIPDIDVYGSVLKRYQEDPKQFGLDSAKYKTENGRINHKSPIKIGYLSGTFDLFHIGHLNVLKRAKEYCDYLVVGVHPDGSHKGKTVFIPLEERKEIVASIKYVDKVIDSKPEDSDVWDDIHYDFLFVGSDYKGSERFNRYEEYFKDKGVKIIYFPYTKGTSSTQLREALSSLSKDKK
jgi:glycerol-3-phosphate cytidylyltransferase